jgi:hypothetical protein
VAKSRFGSPEAEVQIDLEARKALAATPTMPALPTPPAAKTDSVAAVQRVFLAREQFASLDKAAAWVAAHAFSNASVVEFEEGFEFKQAEEDTFLLGSLTTVNLIPGVDASIGIPKDDVTTLLNGGLNEAS